MSSTRAGPLFIDTPRSNARRQARTGRHVPKVEVASSSLVSRLAAHQTSMMRPRRGLRSALVTAPVVVALTADGSQ